MHNHRGVALPPGDYRDDAMLTTAANNALAASTGETQRDAVVRAAWRGHAVMAVVDQIEITG